MPGTSLEPFSPSAHAPQTVWQTAHCRIAHLAALACQACVINQLSRACIFMSPIREPSVTHTTFLKHLQHCQFTLCSFPSGAGCCIRDRVACQGRSAAYPCTTESICGLRKNAYIQLQPASLSPTEVSRTRRGWNSTVSTPTP